MRKQFLVPMLLTALCGLSGSLVTQCAAQSEVATLKPLPSSMERSADAAEADDSKGPMTVLANRALDRALEHEHALDGELQKYHPIIETYIQDVKPDKVMGNLPSKDHYFLGQVDFRGKLKVRSLMEGSFKKPFFWEYVPAGFLQMIYADRAELDRRHYDFRFAKREFLGEVRCYRFDVSPLSKARGPRFLGSIWVEDQDSYIVRVNGYYTPLRTFSLKKFQNEYYMHFESWRSQIQTGEWLPSYVYSQELREPSLFDLPNYKSATHLWGYRLTGNERAEEMSRVLLEDPNAVKDEGPQHDRSPLEAQREWRHEAEDHVLEVLERDGLLAPAGPVDTVLNTIVNNLLITNNLDGQISLRCRLLLTTNVEVFSVGETIVVSRGLIDTVADEATLATFLAHGVADAILPKPYQDQYGFSDTLRWTATEVLKKLSFQETPAEVGENSRKAIELLKKSPYAAKLGNAGLFLKQLQSESKALQHLIEPQLGSELYFSSQLLQAAPALRPEDKSQTPALPLGSRLKVDAWSANVSLMKTKPVQVFSVRDKMPFEITPLLPYLTRYSETAPPAATPPANSSPANPSFD
jgi:hypothetical protein